MFTLIISYQERLSPEKTFNFHFFFFTLLKNYVKPHCCTRCTFDEKHKNRNRNYALYHRIIIVAQAKKQSISLFSWHTNDVFHAATSGDTKKLAGETLFGTPRYGKRMQKRKIRSGGNKSSSRNPRWLHKPAVEDRPVRKIQSCILRQGTLVPHK